MIIFRSVLLGLEVEAESYLVAISIGYVLVGFSLFWILSSL